MVVPPRGYVAVPVADLHAEADERSELVDQVHYAEQLTVLASREGWHFVQAVEDHYFGWIAEDGVIVFPAPSRPQGRRVGVTVAPVHRAADASSEILGYLPAGTLLAPAGEQDEGEFVQVALGRPSPMPRGPSLGYVAISDAAEAATLAHRPPTSADLIRTAEAFLGVPYLWGGTTALGIDCSGFVQQVYRLNGIRLDRDADQQSLEGRPVEVARAGDLVFFSPARGDPGAERVTHVALATGERTFLHAPEAGARVELGELPAEGRAPRAIRRYLP